jgi:hypothetical protein
MLSGSNFHVRDRMLVVQPRVESLQVQAKALADAVHVRGVVEADSPRLFSADRTVAEGARCRGVQRRPHLRFDVLAPPKDVLEFGVQPVN